MQLPDRTSPGRRPVVAAVLAALVVLAASFATGGIQAPAFAAGTFEVQGSVNQVATWGHTEGASLELRDHDDAVVATGVADAQGAYLFREVAIGDAYSVVDGVDQVGGIQVLGPTDHPDGSFYDAIDLGPKPPGKNNLYTYIPTRDGTLLSANIVFPSDGSTGPWPVVVNYSGYSPSAPPNPPQESLMFPIKGYVTVGVNMRGTGCSGGAFDIFEMLQSLDGYDVVETLARQSWANGNIGLVGISYPGISQLFVAQTRPPSLDAITPLSVYDDFYRGIGYPGGVINAGFFLDWLRDRDDSAEPAASGWARDRIAEGDTTCADNQVLRLQSKKSIPQAVPGRFYETRGAYLSPETFVGQITVPTFLSGAFQDEQTGGHWASMIGAFDPATTLRVQLTNGTHVESLGPEHLNRYLEFVDFYVGKRVPSTPPLLAAGAPLLFEALMGTPDAPLPPDRFTGQDYATALAAYEAEPPVRVYWENGAGRNAGEALSTVQADYASWPLPGTTAQPWYFQADGALSTTAPTLAAGEPRGVSSYRYDPTTKDPKRTFDGGTDEMWKPLPDVHWKPLVEGSSLNFVSEPFAAETAFAGWGSADLWLRSTAPDTDVEVTITEVRPDGKETFVQSGWLRASRRALDTARSDELMPVHSHLEADAEPLPAGEFSLARVEMFPFAHVVRAGSRLRINVEVPGGNQPFWQTDPMAASGTVVNDVAHTSAMPSRIVLPLVSAASAPNVPAALPPCPGLRGQACRPYLPAHIVTGVTAVVAGDDIEVSWSPPPVTEAPTVPGDDPASVAIAPDGVPSGYRVTVAPSGETFDVAGDVTSFTYPSAALDTAFSFTVTALYGTDVAPTSNASLTVLIQSPEPSTTTTTTTAAPASSTTTPAPSSSTTIAGGSASSAAPGSTTSSGSLPLTGAAIVGLVVLAAVLLVGGLVLASVSRRSKVEPEPDADPDTGPDPDAG